MELKKKVEALLFSSGKRMNIGEIARLCKAREEDVRQALAELKERYDEGSSLMLIDEGNFWKLTVRGQYLPVVQKIVTETELTKTVLETLAVIAFKYPIKQSELIKIRTNKAYDHLNELEEAGYISRQKHGRTKLIKLTDKFFSYFDLPPEKLKEKFQDFESIAKVIEEKEQEIEKMRQDQRKKAEEAKMEDEKRREAAESVGKETSEIEFQQEKPHITIEEEKLGDLEVVEEPSEEEIEKERERIRKIGEEDKKEIEQKKEKKPGQRKKMKGIQLTDETEKEVDKRVEEIMHPKENEGNVEEKENEEIDAEEKIGKKEKSEPKDLLEAAMEEAKKENKQKQQ